MPPPKEGEVMIVASVKGDRQFKFKDGRFIEVTPKPSARRPETKKRSWQR